ncbi:MAG: XdhC/CoxI family protein [Bacteroidetes bacterium]|nr:XdhC/CoxI family protein [Bacteroidota bacterium]
MESIYSKVEAIRNEQKRAAICIVTDTRGSTPRKPGSKMIVYEDGSIYGSIGGGSVEKDVAGKAVELIASGMPAKCTFDLEEDLAMHCGGYMEVYIEPINPLDKLYIFGAGHVGKAVSRFARELDFSVTLVDPREGIFEDPLFQGCTCINKDYFISIEEAPFNENTYCVIVTPKHQYDEDILAKLAVKPHAYLGMIGSTRKVELLKKRFLEEKILSREELEMIDMPIGIKFNAETPQEIAVSIVAKLIDVRNTRNNSKS